ncbi:MAG: hypothetical protein ACREMY_09630, partial [bacterium]
MPTKAGQVQAYCLAPWAVLEGRWLVRLSSLLEALLSAELVGLCWEEMLECLPVMKCTTQFFIEAGTTDDVW